MKKAAFILALVMLLGVAAGCGESNGEASVQSVSMICGIGTAGLTDRFAGVVSAMGETNIKKDDSLTIGEIKVKVGDAVKVGDVLFTYDMSQLEISLEEAQIALEDLKATLADKEEEKKQAEAALNEIVDDIERNKTLGQIRQLNPLPQSPGLHIIAPILHPGQSPGGTQHIAGPGTNRGQPQQYDRSPR